MSTLANHTTPLRVPLYRYTMTDDGRSRTCWTFEPEKIHSTEAYDAEGRYEGLTVERSEPHYVGEADFPAGSELARVMGGELVVFLPGGRPITASEYIQCR